MAMQRSGAVAIVLTALGASLGGVLLYRDRLSPELQQYRSGLAEQTRELSGEPESVSDGAVAQRYKARRAAVEAMIADLRRLVAAESTLAVDSGYPRNNIPPHYWTGPSRGNVGPFITLTRNGWWATMSNTLTGIHCAVAVGGDTTFASAQQGEPWCFGENDWRGAR